MIRKRRITRMGKVINYGTKFKFEWAEGKRSETDKYVGKELSFKEFIYIITKRHHEIASRNITEGFYGTYDKHKCWVKYDDESDWEILDRLDLGNDEDFVYIQKMISDNFTTDVNFYWSDAVRDGAEMWKMREDGLADLPEDLKNWIRYERVRMSGKYNMVTEAGYASYEANLSMEDYREVQKNYTDLAMKAIEKIGREKIKELVEK